MADRLFFALPVSRHNQLALLKLQAQLSARVPDARVVPAANFHLTLAFLGKVTHQQQLALRQRWQELPVPSGQIVLDQLVFWPGAGVIALAASQVPMGLNRLANQLRQDAARHGLHQSRRGFRPHLTLFRKAKFLPGDLPEVEPVVQPIEQVELMVSLPESGGVVYEPLAIWHQ